MSSDPVISVQSLTKFYGPHRGIEAVDFEVSRGEIFGLLGPNGAGKTTLIRIMLDLIRPTSGKASVFGLDCQKDHLAVMERLGYVPGEVSVYDHLTGEAFLDYCMSLYRRDHPDRREEIAGKLDITFSKKLGDCSKGMKQKIMIVQALMHDPDLLLLDEPTSGLDPLTQRAVNDLLFEEKSKGKTVFVSSHILPEVEKICDRAGIIRDGRLAAIEGVQNIHSKRLKRMDIEFVHEVSRQALEVAGVTGIEGGGRRYTLFISGDLNPAVQAISQHRLIDMSYQDASFEDIFMKYYDKERPSP